MSLERNRFQNVKTLLGIKINYLEDQLNVMPDIKKWRTKGGIVYKGPDSSRHLATTKKGMELASVYEKKEKCKSELRQLNSYWLSMTNYVFCRDCFDYKPSLRRNRNKELFGDFDSLIEYKNTHPNKKDHWYNGKNYDSKSEAKIAEILDGFHLEHKHNVKLNFKLSYDYYVDSVFYIREIDRYVIHEHFGRVSNKPEDREYVEQMIQKIKHALSIGLVPGQDIVYTFEGADNPADALYLKSQIEAAINANL